MPPEITGTVAPGFEPVAEAFAGNLHDRGDAAAQCCVHLGGQPVVDLTCGLDPDAIQVVFSATKGATAACANLLVQRGLLDLDRLVTDYWPEFGANGKDRTLVRWLLTHRAGVLAPPPGLSLDDLADWPAVVALLAGQPPAWEPGAAYGYHAHTFGWLVGELVRRVDGRGLGRFFQAEIAGPAGADFWIGLPAAAEPRLAPIIPATPAAPDLAQVFGPHLAAAMTLNGALPDDLADAAADRRFRAGEFGGAGGVSNARGLSRMYAWLLDTYTTGTVADLLRPETDGPDLVLSGPGVTVEFELARGFTVHGPWHPEVGGTTFGHSGAGGTTAFADPAHRLAFGYTSTRMVLGQPEADPRVTALVHATYQALGDRDRALS